MIVTKKFKPKKYPKGFNLHNVLYRLKTGTEIKS